MQRVVKIVRASWQWIALAAVAALGLTGYVWYQNYQDEQARLAALAALRTESIGRGDLVAVVSATGSLQPDRQASLFFLVPGTVQAVLVESGQTVTAGQVLARLDSAELRLAIAQAESVVEIAKLNRLKLLASPTADDIAIAKANLRAANAAAADLQRGAGPQEAEIAKLQYDNARADYQAAADQYNSLVEFAEQNPRFAPSGEALDQLKANLENVFYQSEIARLQWEQAKQTADPGSLTVAYRRIAQAQAQLDQVSLPPTQLQIDRADLAVAQAELALDQARLQLARTELRAPFDGVVAAVNARAGEAIGLSQPAVVLIDVDRFRLDLTVNEVDVAQLAEGQAVAVTVDAVPDEVITGRVERIAPTSLVVGGAVNYLVRVVLDPSQAALRAGMSATAEVTVATVEQVLLAPNWAIRRDRRTGQAFVSLKEGEALREAPIVTGLRGDDYTEVKSGVSVGDVAAVSTVRDNPFETGN